MDRSELEYGLKHYGVPGMRWGKRGAKAVTLKERPGKFVKAKGGQKQSAADDAKKAAITKRKAKKSTTDSLSNKELQELVQRMNLEVQYKNLSKQQRSLGRRVLGKIMDRHENDFVNDIYDLLNSKK